MNEPKGSYLRQLRLLLYREATLPETTLPDVAALQDRLATLMAGRGALLLERRPEPGSPLQRVLDTGLQAAIAACFGLVPPGQPVLSRALALQVLDHQEAVHLKSSELEQLLETGGIESDSRDEIGVGRGNCSPVSAVLLPLGPNALLTLLGPDLGPEDLASAEELGQMLFLLAQSLERQSRDALDLEHLLQTSQELIHQDDLYRTLGRVAEQIRVHLGFDIVALSLVEGKLVHNKVLLGVDDEVRARYAGLTSTLEDLKTFLDPRFQISSSFFVPRNADVYTDQNRYCVYCPQLEEKPEGMWQPGDNLLTPLRDASGRLAGVISLDAPRDWLRPTREKALLLELYANRAALAVATSTQIRELTNLNQELRDLDRMRSEFVANISHELRTPVASILGYAHLLLDHGSENLGERQRHFLAVLSKSTERLSSLVDNLVDISEFNAEDPTLKSERLDLRDVYHEVLARLESQIRLHHLELRETLGKEPLVVIGDRHRLRQVFFGILSNAVLFNRDEGVIEVEMERSSASMISVRIADTGPGLSRDKLHEILDRFYQVDHAGHPLEVDSRMGLSIAYKHVRAHRGNLVMQSEAGAGTRVTVTLPAAADAT